MESYYSGDYRPERCDLNSWQTSFNNVTLYSRRSTAKQTADALMSLDQSLSCAIQYYDGVWVIVKTS